MIELKKKKKTGLTICCPQEIHISFKYTQRKKKRRNKKHKERAKG